MSLEDRRKPKKVKQKIDTKKAQNSFIEELKNLNIYDRLNHSLECDPNINYRILMDTVTECRQKHFPSKLVKFNKRRHKSNKWITYGIIKSINTRDEMYRKLLALNINDPRYPELKYNLKIRKSIIEKSIRDVKMKYYHDLFNIYKSDIKNTWKTIKEIFKKTNKKNNYIMKIYSNGKNITNSSEIADEFNIFFAKIGPMLAANLNVNNKKPFQHYLENTVTSEFSFKTVDNSHTDKIIKSLTSKTSFGHDEMTTKSLKKDSSSADTLNHTYH